MGQENSRLKYQEVDPEEKRPFDFGSQSYFGNQDSVIVGKIDKMTPEEVQEKIRQINAKRYLKNNPQSKPNRSQAPIQNPTKLKTFISILDIVLIKLDPYFVLSMKLKAEAKGRCLVLIKRRRHYINFIPGENITVNIPLPYANEPHIHVEIALNLQGIPEKEGFTFVNKHSFEIENLIIASQNIYFGKEFYPIAFNRNVPIIEETYDGKCLFCLSKQAESAIADCQHKVVCDHCLCDLQGHMGHCPKCDRPSIF